MASFRSLALASLVPLAALTATACATSNPVVLEDGSTAHDVSCFGGAWSCRTEAERVCGERPYVVLDDDPMLEIATKGQQGASRVQCVDEYVAANSPQASSPSAGSAAPRASDSDVCGVVYREITPLAKAWGSARHGDPKAEPPPADVFLSACVTLPREAQLCLSAIYRKRHQACPKVLGALNDEAKARLDATLLANRRPEPSDVPLPGTLSL